MLNILKDIEKGRLSKYTFNLYISIFYSIVLSIIWFVLIFLKTKDIFLSLLFSVAIILGISSFELLVVNFDIYGKIKKSKEEYITTRTQFIKSCFYSLLGLLVVLIISWYIINFKFDFNLLSKT